MTQDDQQPDQCTDAYADYCVHSMRLLAGNLFILQLSNACDELVKVIEEAEDSTSTGGNGAAEVSQDKSKRMFEAYQRHLPIYLESSYCRGVDNFLTFISQILSLVFRTKPETMKSDQTIRISDVLLHESMSDFVDYLADETVHRLSYQSFKDLNIWIRSRIGFPFIDDAAALESIVRIVESRNLLVHNRGVVNKIFLRRTGQQLKEGEQLQFSVHTVSSDLGLLDRCALDIEKRAQAKFGLATPVSFGQIRERLAKFSIIVRQSKRD